MMTSMQDSNRMRDSRRQPDRDVIDVEKLEGQESAVMENSEISSPLVLNERPGVRYLCCDRFFKCDGRNLIAREIWPSDDGFIELNRKELKRFIINNKAKRLNGLKVIRHVAGKSSRECSTDSRIQHIPRDGNAPDNESIIQSYRSDLHKILNQYKGEENIYDFNSTSAGIESDKVKTQHKPRMQGNFEQLTENTSQISIISITESPETLITSETTDLKSSTVDESSSDDDESLIGAYNFMQNGRDQLEPAMKPDGTIVIPGVVHVNNFESLDGIMLELKVLIKSPKESRRINVKIDCPNFKPKSVKVNGTETHRLINDHYKT
ncbi:unnamed protein product [Cercopithifilaria johnstoni]|uniref:Uncharacterized protein n=1 Tax=Cercopithifilaria johnstoni TaxID=2874296 RepID=A0A8J2PYW5_9BILA|nr:unnamed protein product [Cercopithifilaria johnstoni]